MAEIPSVSTYALLFEALKRLGILEGYRQGVKAMGEPPPGISPATIDKAKAKVLDVTLATFARKNKKLYEMISNAAFELLIERLYQDLKNGADHVTDSVTPDQLFHQLWKSQSNE